jgi:hypothetical protein
MTGVSMVQFIVGLLALAESTEIDEQDRFDSHWQAHACSTNKCMTSDKGQEMLFVVTCIGASKSP